MMPVASYIPFPFSAPCDVMLAMLVCATCWFSMHLYMLAYMFTRESCLLVCHQCFNTMKLWTFDPNLHFSLMDTTFCLLFFVCLTSCLFACFLVLCLPCLSCLSALRLLYMHFASFSSIACLLVSCLCLCLCMYTHMEQGCMELGHGHPGASKKGEDKGVWI